MLKYYDYAVVMAEFPDEITLAVNISNCPGMCSHCSEPWLLKDIGTPLTNKEIDKLIKKYPDISLFGLMGGDSDHEDAIRIAKYIKEKYKLKVGIYSGREFINLDLVPYIDYYKIGRWIMPQGDSKDWYKTNNGVLQFPWSNQLMFKKEGNHLVNITSKFRTKPLGDLNQYIVK